VDRLKFRAYVRNHQFEVDEPRTWRATNAKPDVDEYVLARSAPAWPRGFVFNATTNGVSRSETWRSRSSPPRNILTSSSSASTTERHPGFDHVTAKLFVQADADPAVLQELWDHTVRTSPVGNSLSRTVTVTPEIDVVD
jgi:hypothetical protein